MSRFRRTLYGWLVKPGCYCLSRHPPDLPQVPIDIFETIAEADADAEARRANVIWSGPALTEKMQRERERARRAG